MSRPYETILIFDSTLDESQVEEKLERLKRALTNGEEPAAIAVTHWGKRKLAYPIQKKEQGIYVILHHDSEPHRLAEFERIARLDEQVLRQLTVVNPVEPRAGRQAAAPRSEEE